MDFDELSFYTLAHGDPAYIHQYVVDAHGAQCAGPGDKPVRLAFALAGLYLHVERRFDGRQVQRAHMRLAQRKQAWPRFELPTERGRLTVRDVLAAPPGPERDRMIERWCESTWSAFADSRPHLVQWLEANGIE